MSALHHIHYNTNHPTRVCQTMRPVASDLTLPTFFLDHLGRMPEDKVSRLESRVDNLTVLWSVMKG